MSNATYDVNRFANELNAMIATVNTLPMRLVQPVFNRSLNKFGRSYVGSVQKSIKGRTGDKSTLHSRTGALKRAFNHSTVSNGSGQSLVIWVDNSVNKYWRTQEEGKTIRAKPGHFLSIPTGPALTPAGVSRYTSPRQIGDLFFVKNKKGTRMLARNNGGKLMVYFILKKEVTVPPRLGLAEKWKAQLPSIIPILKQETKIALNSIKNQ